MAKPSRLSLVALLLIILRRTNDSPGTWIGRQPTALLNYRNDQVENLIGDARLARSLPHGVAVVKPFGPHPSLRGERTKEGKKTSLFMPPRYHNLLALSLDSVHAMCGTRLLGHICCTSCTPSAVAAACPCGSPPLPLTPDARPLPTSPHSPSRGGESRWRSSAVPRSGHSPSPSGTGTRATAGRDGRGSPPTPELPRLSSVQRCWSHLYPAY